MRCVRHLVPNGDGWLLSLTQTWDPDRLDPKLRPIVIVPGYAMNSFIYSYHPNGVSLEGYLCEAGFEVWRGDLRAQGESMSTGGREDFAIEDLALTDVGVVLRAVLERTRSRCDAVDVLGGSLGGTLIFAHAALRPDHRMRTMVCIGSPVRWVKVHPALKVAFVSPTLVGLVRLKGTRKLASIALPLIAKFTPWLLSIYMNPEITDTSAAREMAKTVEDPNRHINRQIAQWMHDRDLVIDGVNLSEALARMENPLLDVLAMGDGIVPPETAAWPFHQIGSRAKKLVEVGSKTMSMAHADLFVSREAHLRVFQPVRDWYLAQQQPRLGESAQRIE